MKRNLAGLLIVALCSSVAFARTSPDNRGGKRQAEEQPHKYEVEENTGFQIFEHGIWPRQGGKLEQGVTPADRYWLPNAKKGPKYRIDHSAEAKRATYLPSISAAERKHALPFGLLDALIWQESRYNPWAISPAGAGGLTQLMPGTASDLGVRNRFDPAANIEGGARYLRQMLDQFGAIHLALAAYNAGPGAVRRAQGIPGNSETPGYVRKVLARWTELKR